MNIIGCTNSNGYIFSKINISKLTSANVSFSIGSTYDVGDCPIAGIVTNDFDPNNIISITSKENDYDLNTNQSYSLIKSRISNGCFVPNIDIIAGLEQYYKFLISDYIKNETNTPLFYQYELMFDVKGSPSFDLISIYKNNTEFVNFNEYIVQYSSSLLENGTVRYSPSNWNSVSLNGINRVRLLLPAYFSNKDDFYLVKYNKTYNGISSYREELLELKPIYTTPEDYSVTVTGIAVSGNISSSIQELNIIRDPDRTIKPVMIEPKGTQTNTNTSWKLRINPGIIPVNSGLINTSISGYAYILNNIYNTEPIAQSRVKVSNIYGKIIHSDYWPIYVDTNLYKYPDYKVNTYDSKITTFSTIGSGLAIFKNGYTDPNIKILSLDRNKGYIHIDSELSMLDIPELSLYVNHSGCMLLDNLELNPRMSGTTYQYHINDFKNGLGIALRSYDLTASGSFYPYIYDVGSGVLNNKIHSLYPSGQSSEYWNWNSGNVISLCELYVNDIPASYATIYDIRRGAGGIATDESIKKHYANMSGVSNNELNWFSDKIYFDGEPLSFGNTLIINIPSGSFYSLRDSFINYYRTVYSNYDMATDVGNREFKSYLHQVVKRYISAGSTYVIIPVDSSGNFGDIINLAR